MRRFLPILFVTGVMLLLSSLSSPGSTGARSDIVTSCTGDLFLRKGDGVPSPVAAPAIAAPSVSEGFASLPLGICL